jgi:calcineurin-like phosphoesterase family protein
MKFFTSDTHFYHKNVIKYSNRPYENIEEMHEDMIDRWNRAVTKGDLVYHLGDFSLETRPELIDAILGRLNGKIILIQGNHDKWLKNINKLRHGNKFIKVVDYDETNLQHPNGTHIKASLMHYPMHTWNRSHHGSIQLHGHCHGSIDAQNRNLRRMDVGVDSEYGQFSPIPETFIADVLTLPERDFSFHHGD